MTTAERLLDLTVEYQEAKGAREWSSAFGPPSSREPSEIAEEYVTVLREVLREPISS